MVTMILDEFQTIGQESHAEIKIKGSSFIGVAAPVLDKSAAEAVLESLSKKYYDATHHCYAYTLGVEPHQSTRYSDDGEPSGTAGRPILQAIRGKNLTDLIVVVTRYFGGTKLGTGGLTRAYSDCAQATLDQAVVITKIITGTVRIAYPYTETNAVMRLIQSVNGRIVHSEYGQAVSLTVEVRLREIGAFKANLIDRTGNRVRISETIA